MSLAGVGIIVPSSNTCLEPELSRLFSGEPVRLHATRLRVSRIGLDEVAAAQFNRSHMLDAARLLADAGVELICWGGTSGSWLGVEADISLCADITDLTGVVATTSTLALIDAFASLGVDRIGLSVPYLSDVAAAIAQCYAAVGLHCVATRCLELEDNASFANVSSENIDELVRTAAVPAAQAIGVVCTNMTCAPRLESLEATIGIPVVDSIAATAWQIRTLLGLSSRRVA